MRCLVICVAAAVCLLTGCDAQSPPSGEPRGTVVGHRSEPYNCTGEKVPTCDWSYALKVRSGGSTTEVPVDVIAYTACRFGDQYSVCDHRLSEKTGE